MLLFEIIGEKRIREAIARGEFDNLPGAGRPIDFEDELLVPPEQRMVNRIMKRAGLVPADVSLRRAIARLRDEIRRMAEDDEASERKRRELTYLLLKSDEERRST